MPEVEYVLCDPALEWGKALDDGADGVWDEAGAKTRAQWIASGISSAVAYKGAMRFRASSKNQARGWRWSSTWMAAADVAVGGFRCFRDKLSDKVAL